MTVKIGDDVIVRRLGQKETSPGAVTALHGGDHVTCEIETENGTEIESVGFSKGHAVDGSWDWPKGKTG